MLDGDDSGLHTQVESNRPDEFKYLGFIRGTASGTASRFSTLLDPGQFPMQAFPS
jgi:hypothetical protein